MSFNIIPLKSVFYHLASKNNELFDFRIFAYDSKVKRDFMSF